MAFPEHISLSPRYGGSLLGQKQWLQSTLSLWQASTSQTRRGSYVGDRKKDIAEEEGEVLRQDMAVVCNVFQR